MVIESLASLLREVGRDAEADVLEARAAATGEAQAEGQGDDG